MSTAIGRRSAASMYREQSTRLAVKAAARVFRKRGGSVEREAERPLDFVGTIDHGPRVAVRAFAYAVNFDPELAPLGGVTGIDNSTFRQLQDAQAASGVPLWIHFVDCVLGACYWATLDQLQAGGRFERVDKRTVELPVMRMKHGTSLQLLWPVLWFHDVVGNWEPLTDLEVAALRRLRTPVSKSGIARLGHEDEERDAFARFADAWRARRSQGSLF